VRLGWAAIIMIYSPLPLAFLGTLLAAVFEPPSGAWRGVFPMVIVALVLGAPLLAVVGLSVSNRQRGKLGAVRIEQGGLLVHSVHGRRSKRRTIPRAQLVGGVIVPLWQGRWSRLDLQIDGGDVLSIELDDDRAAELLEGLGLGLSQRCVSLRTCGPRPRVLWAALALLPMLFVTMVIFRVLAWPVCGVVLWGLGALTAPPTVTIGADGVTVRRWRRSRFIPYEAIQHVLHYGRLLAIELGDGDVIRLGSGKAVYAQAIAARIQAGRAARQTAGRPSAHGADLDRKGRPLASWREALQRVVGAAHYREAAWSADALQAVLADGGSSGERRLGAAIALREVDSEASARIRVAAETSARDALRVALETLANGQPDEDLERSLEKLSKTESNANVRRV